MENNLYWSQLIKENIKLKKKWEKFEFERYGNPFKLLVQIDSNGEIIQVMEKPDFKKIGEGITASGAHIVLSNPERNHLDYYKDREKVKVEKTPNENHIIGLV